MRNRIKLRVGGIVAIFTVLTTSCSSGNGAATSSVPVVSTGTAATAVASTSATRPAAWTVTVTATVTTRDGAEPFTLRAESPVTFTTRTKPITVVLVATASSPVVVIGRPDVFNGRLDGPGVLDVLGPVCSSGDATRSPSDFCSADPAVLPIGVAYRDVTAPKPTGPVLDAARIPLTLGVKDVRAGTYGIRESFSWLPANDATARTEMAAVVVLEFDVLGPE